MLRREKIVAVSAVLLLAFILLPRWERSARAQAPELDAKTQPALVDAANSELKAFGGESPIPGTVLGVWIPGKAP
jgi:hypothetical protein